MNAISVYRIHGTPQPKYDPIPNREKGYYWVFCYSDWAIAEWVGDRWFLCGDECEVYDNEIEEIDGTPIKRQQ
jgi:hypothetical protein